MGTIRTTRSILLLMILPTLLLPALPGGCSAQRAASPYAAHPPETRDPALAHRLTAEAADLIDLDPDRAERLLRTALAADLYHGPAHNNLGVLYLERGRLYEAAAEFEWARKLMPGHPDPRMNLALTLELAGRYDNALATYRTALEVYPEHLPTLQAAARLQIRTMRTDEHTPAYLRAVAMRSEDRTWRDWAQRQLIRLGHTD